MAIIKKIIVYRSEIKPFGSSCSEAIKVSTMDDIMQNIIGIYDTQEEANIKDNMGSIYNSVTINFEIQ